ncbi:hypothetical protein SK128_012895 [Halocaridina rubra]|uniref:DUF1279 domain-containing protein n=1 Tax=Halocaridina rubra TaxID=373956 RepID=A0AAN8WLE3_HALRR
MATSFLKSIHCGRRISSAVVRQKHTLLPGEGRINDVAGVQQQQQPHQHMHQVVVRQTGVPPPPSIVSVPPNVEEIQATAKAQFSPHRARDTSSARIAAYGSLYGSGPMRSEGVRESRFNVSSVPVDRHVDVYDRNDTVALDSLVQTNVPKPYGLSGQAPSQFSSPDCHGAQGDKYVAGDLQDHHQSTQVSSKKTPGIAVNKSFGILGSTRGMRGVPYNSGQLLRNYGTMCSACRLVSMRMQLNCSNSVHPFHNNFTIYSGCLCVNRTLEKTSSKYLHTCVVARLQESNQNLNKDVQTSETQLTSRQKLQRAVKEYGVTVIVFHVTISLASLGICYLLVSR